MAKRKSETLKFVWELEAQKEDSALKVLAIAQKELSQHQAQLQSLSSYRSQYQSDLNAGMSQLQGTQPLMAAHHFFNQMSDAIEQQNLIVQHAQVRCDQAKQQWALIHQKATNLKSMYEDQLRIEAAQDEKKEQSRLDDLYLAKRFRQSRGH